MRHSFQQHGPAQRQGLTRVEVVVVAALAVVTLATVRPILLHARTAGPAAVCMANLKALMQAWLLYAQDYDDQVVGPRPCGGDAYSLEPYPADPPGPSRRVWNFVGTPQDENGTTRNDVLEDELRGFRRGGLWSYLEAHQVFHCPADRRFLSAPTYPYGAFGQKGGFRTYSLGAVWNCYTGGWDTGEDKVVVYKTNEITEPESKLVFLEEADQYGYNANTWNLFLNRRDTWGDPFAIFHGEKSMFGFADGHAGPHRWTNEHTFEMAEVNMKRYPTNGQYDDIDWFRWHYVPGNMPDEFKDI